MVGEDSTRRAKCGDGMQDLSIVTISRWSSAFFGLAFTCRFIARQSCVAECHFIVRRSPSISEQMGNG
jgi:hypothetical protein